MNIINKYLFTTCIVVFCITTVTAQTGYSTEIEEGIQYYTAQWKQKSDPTTAYNLGLIFASEHVNDKDQARKWFKIAADGGHALAKRYYSMFSNAVESNKKAASKRPKNKKAQSKKPSIGAKSPITDREYTIKPGDSLYIVTRRFLKGHNISENRSNIRIYSKRLFDNSPDAFRHNDINNLVINKELYFSKENVASTTPIVPTIESVSEEKKAVKHQATTPDAVVVNIPGAVEPIKDTSSTQVGNTQLSLAMSKLKADKNRLSVDIYALEETLKATEARLFKATEKNTTYQNELAAANGEINKLTSALSETKKQYEESILLKGQLMNEKKQLVIQRSDNEEKIIERDARIIALESQERLLTKNNEEQRNRISSLITRLSEKEDHISLIETNLSNALSANEQMKGRIEEDNRKLKKVLVAIEDIANLDRGQQALSTNATASQQ